MGVILAFETVDQGVLGRVTAYFVIFKLGLVVTVDCHAGVDVRLFLAEVLVILIVIICAILLLCLIFFAWLHLW